MADLSRVRDPLEIAAASPDPKIRHMAIRRKELEPEMRRLDSFFEVYAGEPDSTAASIPAKAPMPAKAVTQKAPSIKAKSPIPSSAAVCEAAKAILLRHGPLDKDTLLRYYRENVPSDFERTPRAFRDALAKGKIGTLSRTDHRYWPIGHVVPAANGSA